MRDERIDEEPTGNAWKRIPQESRRGDDARAVGHNEISIVCDAREVLVGAREHHEFGVRRDDERALAGIETAQDALHGRGEVDAVEAHAEHVDPRGHDLT